MASIGGSLTFVAHEGVPVYTWGMTGAMQRDVGALSASLQALGVKGGDAIGIGCADRRAWLVIDYAAAVNEYMVIGVTAEDDAGGTGEAAWADEVRVVFCDTLRVFESVLRTLALRPTSTAVEYIVTSGELAAASDTAVLGAWCGLHQDPYFLRGSMCTALGAETIYTVDTACSDATAPDDEHDHENYQSAPASLSPEIAPICAPPACVEEAASPYTTPPQQPQRRVALGGLPVNVRVHASRSVSVDRKRPTAVSAERGTAPPVLRTLSPPAVQEAVERAVVAATEPRATAAVMSPPAARAVSPPPGRVPPRGPRARTGARARTCTRNIRQWVRERSQTFVKQMVEQGWWAVFLMVSGLL